MTPEEIIEKFLEDLGEHCDSIQVLASVVNDNGGTSSLQFGAGNWYARQGLAHEFIHMDQSADIARAISQFTTPPDEGDEWKKPDDN